MWLEMLNLQDQNVPWPLPASHHCPVTSPQTIKLCLFTFKCRILQWFKLTLPLACALDLAALENIPSLSFRNVYWFQPGVMKLFSVLILIPRCLRCITGPSHSCALVWRKTDSSSWFKHKMMSNTQHIGKYTYLLSCQELNKKMKTAGVKAALSQKAVLSVRRKV